jgi:hypothetical protein
MSQLVAFQWIGELSVPEEVAEVLVSLGPRLRELALPM